MQAPNSTKSPSASSTYKVSAASASFAADIGTPIAIFEKLSRQSSHAFLFESTEGDGRLARYSFLGIDPLITVRFEKGQAITTNRLTNERSETKVDNPVSYLQSLSVQYAQQFDIARLAQNEQSGAFGEFLAAHKDLPFLSGFVGYMGYATASYLEPVPAFKKDTVQVPDAYYCLYDSLLIFDHQFRRVSIVSLRGEEQVERLKALISQTSNLLPLQLNLKPLTEEEIFEGVETSVTRDEFIESIEKAKSYVSEGQVFQIVISQRFTLSIEASAIDLYRMLVATNPSPYAYFLKFPEFTYLGSSPETFVQCRNRHLLLRALAGTRPRGKTAEIDEQLAHDLKNDEKEMAEHRMLVDLGRNDLGRVCTPGSVKWGELAFLTKYTHVMHLATEITGELSQDDTPFAAFQSCFPAGTVSGAPKVRAMQLIAKLEPETRGIYSGAVGYFDLNGNMDGAIAIRSALIKDGKVHVNAGAGIVYDSKPDLEYQESRNKAKSVLQAVKLAERAKK